MPLDGGRKRGGTEEVACRDRKTPTESLASSTGLGAALLSVPGRSSGDPYGPEVGDDIYPAHLPVPVETP